MKRLTLTVLILALGYAGNAQAQSSHSVVRPETDINLVVAFPQGELRDNVSSAGLGLSIFGGVRIKPTPVVLGLDGTFLVYGFERRDVPFSLTIPDVTVGVETSNYIVGGHLVLRLDPLQGPVQPYLDGLFGLKYFYTQTKILNNNILGSDSDFSSVNFDDTALSYGVGGGINIDIRRGSRAMVGISVSARYLFGGSAEYLTEGAVTRVGSRVIYSTDRSETHLLVTQLGVSFRF